MKRRSLLFVIFAAVCGCSTMAAGAEIVDFSFWELISKVDINLAGPTQGHFAPQTPFSLTQNTSLGLTTSTTTYDAWWNDQELSFGATFDHHLADVPSTQSSHARSTGTWWFETTQPLRVTVDLLYDYNIPAPEFSALAVFGVSSLTTGQGFGDNFNMGPAFFDPAVGTFSINHTFEIAADDSFELSYSFRLRTSGTNTSVIGTGTGHLNVFMEVIPEPHTALLLLIAVPIRLLRRSHNRF